jgi:hypothetical protein
MSKVEKIDKKITHLNKKIDKLKEKKVKLLATTAVLKTKENFEQ